MGEVVDLHGQPAHLEDDLEFVGDSARYAEGILSEEAVKKKYHFRRRYLGATRQQRRAHREH